MKSHEIIFNITTLKITFLCYTYFNKIEEGGVLFVEYIIKKQFFKQLVVFVLFILLLFGTVGIFLYNQTVEEFKERQKIVKDILVASFVEVAKFDKKNENIYKNTYGSSQKATLSQIFSTLERLNLKNIDIDIGSADNNILTISSYNKTTKHFEDFNITFGSELAIPMQTAFRTTSKGYITQNDHKNNTVLAKYSYIPELDIAIVVKSKISLIQHYLYIIILLLIAAALVFTAFIYFVLRISQKPIENSLIKSEEKFKNIFDNASDGIVIHDLQGTILEVNSVKSIRLGYSVEELIGKDISFLNTSSFSEKIPERMKELLQYKYATFESEHLTKDGRIIPVEIHAKLIEYNSETAVLSVIRDITERKQAEADLILAKEEAEAANAAKSLFLSNMSHEIRTPLNGIIGLTQLTLDTELSTQQRYYLNKVQISSHSLLHIINDILDYSKIQAGKLALVNEPFELEQILENLSGLFGFSAEKKGLELFFNINQNVPLTLIGDQIRFTQILINLIGNAIKFTDSGEIILTINVLSLEKNQCELEITVKDTGVGIEEENQKKLFKNFSQVDNSYQRKHEGTGLGLAISKELVELMHGEISIDSVYGEGSTLRFNAKFEISDSPQYAVQNIKRSDSVLVVDDSETSRIILLDILSSIGMKVDLCEDGMQALQKVELSLQNKKLYDFILLDWKMPKLSGAETAIKIDELYKQFEVNHEPMVVMVTAYSKDELIDELNQYNIKPANVILKPVTASSLYDALIMRKQKTHANSEKSIYKYDARLKTIQGADILLVEDNEINQDVAKAYLVKMKVNVTVANNGLEALHLVEKNSYDLVLMDLQMPVMDGIKATKEIKKIKDKKEIPIVAMTAAAMEKDRENSKNAGMQAHITKPIEFEELTEILLEFIKPNIENRSFKVKGKKTLTTLSKFPQTIEGVNVTKLLAKLDQDSLLASKLLLDFVKKYEHSDKELEENSIGTQEFDTFIHTLKSVSGNLLIGEVYRLAKTINESDDVNEKTSLLKILKSELVNAVKNIKRSMQAHATNVAVSLLSKEETVALIDAIITKIDSNFMIGFEDIQNLLEQLRTVVDDLQVKELEENFDQLLYENIKENLNGIKENLEQEDRQ